MLEDQLNGVDFISAINHFVVKGDFEQLLQDALIDRVEASA